MLQLISLFIFIISLSGIAALLYSKAPAVARLPKNGSIGIKKSQFIVEMERKVKDGYFRLFSKQLLLHKILSKFRIWVLRTERKIDILLRSIRKKAQELDAQVKHKR